MSHDPRRSIWVEIVATRGSAPRDAGTAMEVTAEGTHGTIGGGALEHDAIRTARGLIGKLGADVERSVALGPGLGQCCGGSVRLRFTTTPRKTDDDPVRPLRQIFPAAPRSLWLWGAGHVGRAVVAATPAEVAAITWVDSTPDRFPETVPPHVTVLPVADMPRLAAQAPADTHHLIFTYSHDIDFALCAALLKRGVASIGLIGSDTKRARFFRRLRDAGLDPVPIACPIGDKRLGKAPAAIARGVVKDLLQTEAAA